MLPLKSHLPREEFQARGYKSIKTPFFLLKAKKNNLGYSRIGIVVGKAIYKEATKRNFWKRQAKTILLKSALAGNDLLIIFTPSKATLTKKKFQEDLISALVNR
jgi:ribonuclease P protein component